MTKDSGGPTVDQGGASTPTNEEHDRELAGTTGDAREQGEDRSPEDRDRGEAASGEDQPPIDLAAARDRAS